MHAAKKLYFEKTGQLSPAPNSDAAMDICAHCRRPATTKVHVYWDCELPVCADCSARFEHVTKALESKITAISRLSRSGRYQEAFQSLHQILTENHVMDDFEWLQRNGLREEASIYEHAGQYALAIEKLEAVRNLASLNLSAFIQNQIAIAVNLVKIDRAEDALRELDRALQTSAQPERGHPHPLDIEAALVHYARISKGLGKDIPAQHRELFLQIAAKLGIPGGIWENETSLTAMVLKTREWLKEQDQRPRVTGEAPPPRVWFPCSRGD